MTNREWLESLSDEEFITAVKYECKMCANYDTNSYHEDFAYNGHCCGDCKKHKKEWLRAEHKEDEQ